MEEQGLLPLGDLRLPPGFRFIPTDEELVVQYLRRKALSHPLPASIIPELNVCNLDPWDLPGQMFDEMPNGLNLEKRYFFSQTKEMKRWKGFRSGRVTNSGYWKVLGRDKAVVAVMSGHIVGMKKTLIFYNRKLSHGSRTNWIMHEYRLTGLDNKNQKAMNPSKAWVLCCIFKKSPTKMEDGHSFSVDFFRPGNGDRESTSSESSCVTDFSDGCGSSEENSRNASP